MEVKKKMTPYRPGMETGFEGELTADILKDLETRIVMPSYLWDDRLIAQMREELHIRKVKGYC